MSAPEATHSSATRTTSAYTDKTDGAEAGRHLASLVLEGLGGVEPHAVIVFASSRFDYEKLLAGLRDGCNAKVIVGASSAGEFTGSEHGEGTACALAIHSPEMEFAAGIGRGVSSDRAGAARQATSSFRGLKGHHDLFRSALVLTDALAGHADELVEQLTVLTSGTYQFAGGGAGDDAKFSRTHVFLGTEAVNDAVVVLEILSTKPVGVGVGHGWSPASKPLRVTETKGARIVSLNGLPAVEAFEEHAEESGQTFDRVNALPFFLHNILGIDTGHGHRLRVPLSVNPDGSIECAAEIPTGALVHIMKTTSESACEAASQATKSAVKGLGDAKPGAALFFDCVATRLRMGDTFGFELASVARALEGADFVGCNTYGQIARAEGQFAGFHNCTAVALVFPA